MATTSAPPPASGAPSAPPPASGAPSALPPAPAATTTAPGEDIVIRGVTWPKLIAFISAILAAAGVGIYLLLGVVYGGLQERFDTLGKRVQSLDDNFHGAVAGGISVKDLTEKAPRLEATINDTRIDVATIKAQTQALQSDMTSVKQQLQTLQQSTNQIGVSLARIEPQIQRIEANLVPMAVAPPLPGRPPRRGG